MTPFEEAGYTKDTKFKVTERGSNNSPFKEGGIVWLYSDDGSDFPWFTNGREYCYEEMCLPGTEVGELEVYEGYK